MPAKLNPFTCKPDLVLGPGSGTATVQFDIDANTAPGTDPTLPTGAGAVTISGAAVAAHSVPVETHARSANAFNIEVQVGAAVTGAPGTTDAAGLVQFDDTQFSVDADGYVSLIGGGIAIDSFTTDVSGPVGPDGAGNVDVTGSSIFSDGSVANTLTLNVQATANTLLYGGGANTNISELGPLTNGQLVIGSTGLAPVAGSLASADGSITITPGAGSIDLAVSASDDAILTITGDSGGALPPTAGNINIVSTATNGIDTSGSGSTLTVGMATPYADGDFEFRSSVSGETRELSVTNTSDTASSQAKFTHSVAGSSAGDTWGEWAVGSSRSYALGIDNSDSDYFKMTTAAAATSNPSTADPAFTFKPGTGFNFDNAGTTSNGIGVGVDPTSTQIVNSQLDQNATTAMVVRNATNDTLARAQVVAGSTDSNQTALMICGAANSSTTRIADRGEFQAGSDCAGVNLQTNNASGNIKFYRQNTQLGNVTSAGEWTYDLQPSFLATNSTTLSNQTGAGTAVTVQFDNELFDRGGDYDNTTDTFTAPVTGIYHFEANVFIANVSADMLTFRIDLITTAETFRVQVPNSIEANRSMQISTYASMTATDTAKIEVAVSGGAGDTCQIVGENTVGGLVLTSFSGKLVC